MAIGLEFEGGARGPGVGWDPAEFDFSDLAVTFVLRRHFVF